MSGTSSHLVLEKENGVYSISVNYDSNTLLYYLYLIHNKRSDWEYIIEQGPASFIGYSLEGREDNAEFENYFSRFYYELNGDKDEKSVLFKNLECFCEETYHESFTFFMNKNDKIFVSSQYHVEEDDYDYNVNYQHKPENFIPIEEYFKKYNLYDSLKLAKSRIEKKFFQSHTCFIECDSKEEQIKKFIDLKDEYKNDQFYKENRIKIFKDEDSFDIFIIFKKDIPYHKKYY